MRKHHLTTLIAGATVALLLSPLAASPASASNSYNGAAYVNGAGDPIDDLYDEGVLSTTQNTRSNATCMWQKILWAHQLLAWNDIDGVFGDKTRDATIEFQEAREMNPDGIVGKITFKAAEDGEGGMDINTSTNKGYYIGPLRTFAVYRDSNNSYHFYDRTGADRAAGYNYLTCA
ncbi:peptidoglycan-binding domain-containing protein [Streptomyces sp. NPDC050273]|uniref:peptidoglycan-binding domain-containing protein n=1 Tax=Streptomyces sp. NPDC050273 TaxID=3154933 RepID=UPI0034485E1B